MLTNNSLFLHTLIYVMNQSSIQQDTSYNYYYMEIGKPTNATKCYGVYGCFQLTPPWTSEHRPVSHLPEEIDKIEPNFMVYTRQNPDKYFLIDMNEFDMIPASGIVATKPVYVISHGYMEGGAIQWIKDMAQEFLKVHDCTVIVVDWHGGSSPPYTQAVANIRLVGAMTAHVLHDLALYSGDLALDHVHCVGHSLGGHLCGYIGYTLQSQFNMTLGRITGLDPAEPHFAKARAPVRLDRSAAKYVDIVHTDASQFIRGGLGITEQIGHVDYYPNGGNSQPGCTKSIVQYINDNGGSFYKGFKRYLSCNHVRAYEFFIESINPKCSFVTVSCSSYEDFAAGKCFDCGSKGQKCIKFGYHGRKYYDNLLAHRLLPSNSRLVQYFKTGDNKPFCRGHYKISVKIAASNESLLHGGEIGQLHFTIHSTADGRGPRSEPVTLNGGGFHEPGKTYMAVVATRELDHLRAVEAEWRHSTSLLNPLTWRILTPPKIYVEYVLVETLETKERLVVCPKGQQALTNAQPQLMIRSYC